MILSDIRRYLQQRGQATLADLSLHFDVDPDAMRGMLQVWVRKGVVQKQTATAACGSSCVKCDPAATEIYAVPGYPPSARPVLQTNCVQGPVE